MTQIRLARIRPAQRARTAPLLLVVATLVAGCANAPEPAARDADSASARADEPVASTASNAQPVTLPDPVEIVADSPPASAPTPAFTAVDADGDGALSRGEFTAYARERMGGRPDAFFTRFFDALDGDGDGSASPTEFEQRFEAMQTAQRGGRGGARTARRARPPVRDLENKEADYDANHRRVVARDTFPVLDNPTMTAAADATLGDEEPVIGVVINGEARAYSVAVMGRHELGNDMCGGTPIAVSW